jgi:hypothetical protein
MILAVCAIQNSMVSTIKRLFWSAICRRRSCDNRFPRNVVSLIHCIQADRISGTIPMPGIVASRSVGADARCGRLDVLGGLPGLSLSRRNGGTPDGLYGGANTIAIFILFAFIGLPPLILLALLTRPRTPRL